MSDNPIISITIPIYNVERYLDKCLESIRVQSFQDFEVFMVDDASTDKSVQIAKRFEKQDPRFHSIIQEKGGPGKARNYGIDHATGKYLVFIDSDDYIHKDYLKKMYEEVEKEHADIVSCGVLRVWENGEAANSAIANTENRIVTDIEEYLLTVSHVCWDKMFRKELFDGIRFPEHMTKQDYACVPRVIARASKIVCVSDKLYYYLWREDSITNGIKVNMNLMKAQNILESSELRVNFNRVLEVYFVRNIIGTLLKTMLANNMPISDVKTIMDEAKNNYPDMKRSIQKKYMGDRLFGIMIYEEHYIMAKYYVLFNERVKRIVRPIYRRITHRLRK